MKSSFCPHCGDETLDRQTYCLSCGTIHPNSLLTRVLGQRAPRLICQHCSQPDNPTFIFPKRIDDHNPLFHRGVLNLERCPNPKCQAQNPTGMVGQYHWTWQLLLTLAFWALPLFYILAIILLGIPVSYSTLSDRVSHEIRTSFQHEKIGEVWQIQKGALLPLGWWLVQMSVYTILLPGVWVTSAIQRAYVLRKAPARLGLFKTTRYLAVMPLAVFLATLPLLLILLFAAPEAAGKMGWLLTVSMIATGYLLALLLDRYLPLLGLACFSIYRESWFLKVEELREVPHETKEILRGIKTFFLDDAMHILYVPLCLYAMLVFGALYNDIFTLMPFFVLLYPLFYILCLIVSHLSKGLLYAAFFVPLALVIGLAFLIYWPFSSAFEAFHKHQRRKRRLSW